MIGLRACLRLHLSQRQKIKMSLSSPEFVALLWYVSFKVLLELAWVCSFIARRFLWKILLEFAWVSNLLSDVPFKDFAFSFKVLLELAWVILPDVQLRSRDVQILQTRYKYSIIVNIYSKLWIFRAASLHKTSTQNASMMQYCVKIICYIKFVKQVWVNCSRQWLPNLIEEG